MAPRERIYERIKALMVESLHLDGLDPAEIEDDASFKRLGLDSVDALELIVCLEKEFGIKVPNEQLRRETFESVATLASVVERFLEAREA